MEGTPPAAMWNTYVWVESADESADKVRAAGGSVLTGPFDVEDAGRMAVFADLEGAVFCVWQAKQHRGAAIVNEHGSVNFNELNTRDPDGASSFYGSVFGWEVLDVGGGSMWALPGYGAFLEQRNPGTRATMAAMGAPKRFEDVVASLRPDPRRPARRPRALARDLRRRRRGCDRVAGGRARRARRRAAVRRALGADGGHQRSAGCHLHGKPVRPRQPVHGA